MPAPKVANLVFIVIVMIASIPGILLVVFQQLLFWMSQC